MAKLPASDLACPIQLAATMNSLGFEAIPILDPGVPAPAPGRISEIDYRPAVCRWENHLFKQHPQALRILEEHEALALIREIFATCDSLPAPTLEMVPG